MSIKELYWDEGSGAELAVQQLPVSKLQAAVENPRKDVGDITELAASIRAVGILQPLIVSPAAEGTYLVVIGHRRLVAAKMVGLELVPAIVRDLNDLERLEAMMIENLQRQDLSPLEEASAYERLVGLGHTQRKLAERIGRSQAHISRRLTLLRIPPEAQAALDTGRITVEDGVELAKLADSPGRMKSALKAVKGSSSPGWTIRNQVEELEREKKIEKVRGSLGAEGVRIVDRGVVGYKQEAKTLGPGWQGLNLSQEEHKNEPCHAAFIEPWNATVTYVCMQPKRHASNGESTLKVDVAEDPWEKRRAEQEAESRAWEREREQRLATQERRRAHLRLILKGLPRITEVLERLIRSLLGSEPTSGEGLEIACQLLELEPRKVRTSWGTDEPRYEEAFQDYIEGEPSHAIVRAGLALAFGLYEEQLVGHRVNPSVALEYFAYLQEHGYEPSEIERFQLSELKQAAQEGTCRICGCTDEEACPGGCTWVEPDLCSECVGKEETDGEG